MTKTIIVGGGMLGNELKKTFVNQGHDAIIKKNIKYDSKNIIPKKTTNVIITAQSSDYKNNQFTDDLLYVNTILPMQIIKESFEKDVKNIVYCSTGSVYQKSSKEHKESEKINVKELTPYSSSKFSTEVLIKQWEQYFDSITILRPFFMYGSTQKNSMLFSKMIDSINSGKEITLANNVGLILNPIHMHDASRFISLLLETTKKFKIYNLEGSQEVSLNLIIKQLGKILNKKPNIKTVQKNEDIVLGSIKKMNSINFKHNIMLNQGLKEMTTGKITFKN